VLTFCVLPTTLTFPQKDTENKDFISFLLDIGVSVTNRDRNLWTPVHAASYGASPETLLFLLNSGGESKVYFSFLLISLC
jgi:hypothetical protein